MSDVMFEDVEIPIELDSFQFETLKASGDIHWDQYLEKWQFTKPGFVTVGVKR